MISISISFYILTWTLSVLPTETAWFQRGKSHPIRANRRIRTPDFGVLGTTTDGGTSYNTQGWQPNNSMASSQNPTSQLYTFSVPSASILQPTFTSQGMIVTSVIPIYEVCDMPGSNTAACSTVFETITASSCSTVLTFAFTQATVTDCNQNISFSSQSSYAVATSTIGPTTPLAARMPSSTFSPMVTTYVQSIISYYIAPWQSLAANTPSNITVLICTSDVEGNQTCTDIQEIWVVHTEYVPVVSTSLLSLSTSFASDIVLLLGPTQSITVTAGSFQLSTEIEYSTMSPNATTSISINPRSSFTTSTTTIWTTAQPITITRTISQVTPEPTTTYSSTTTVYSTVTVQPMRRL